MAAPQEIEIATVRRDDKPLSVTRDLDRPRWRPGRRPFHERPRRGLVLGRDLGTGQATIQAGRTSFDVALSEIDGPDLDGVDAAYRSKYGSYADIVDHLGTEGSRAATLEVRPT